MHHYLHIAHSQSITHILMYYQFVPISSYVHLFVQIVTFVAIQDPKYVHQYKK